MKWESTHLISLAMGAGATFTEALKTVVPNAMVSVNSISGNLVALATPADHETIKAAVEMPLMRSRSDRKESAFAQSRRFTAACLYLPESVNGHARVTISGGK